MIGHGWVNAIAENLVNVRNSWYNMEPRDIELLMYGLEYRIAEGSSTITALKKMAEQETNGCTECLN